MREAVANRRVFPYLALTTVGLGLLAGFVVTLVDRQDFPTFGTGVWWAIVTLGTVGYGDVVPHTAWGRVVGSAVIVADVRHQQAPPSAEVVTHRVMVRVDDARAHCERARANGAVIEMEPTDFEYGERQYQAVDLAGHYWTFSETLEDVAPEEWGGILVSP